MTNKTSLGIEKEHKKDKPAMLFNFLAKSIVKNMSHALQKKHAPDNSPNKKRKIRSEIDSNETREDISIKKIDGEFEGIQPLEANPMLSRKLMKICEEGDKMFKGKRLTKVYSPVKNEKRSSLCHRPTKSLDKEIFSVMNEKSLIMSDDDFE